MIAMRPILEQDVLDLLNDGRFDGEVEGYVVMDGPNYLGHMLYRIDGDFIDVLDCGVQESALVDGGVRACVAAGENQRGKLELLAPGGSPERMRAAVNSL